MAGRRFRNARSRKNNSGGRRLTKKQLKQVKRIVTRTQEVKIFDKQITSTGIPTTGAILGPFLNIPQNIGDSQRIGDRIFMKSLNVRMGFIYGDTTNLVRMIWFQWYANNAVETPILGSILQATDITSAINDTNQDGLKFKIMYDKMFALSSTGSNATVSKNLRFYGRRLPRKKLQYNPAATTSFNQIYCLLVSDSIAAPNPTVTAYARANYVDA